MSAAEILRGGVGRKNRRREMWGHLVVYAGPWYDGGYKDNALSETARLRFPLTDTLERSNRGNKLLTVVFLRRMGWEVEFFV